MTTQSRYSRSNPDPTTPPPAKNQNAGPNQAGRIARLLILLGLIVVVTWAGLKAWRIYQAANSLLALQPKAEVLLAGGIQSLDPDVAESLVLDARRDIATLHKELGFLQPIAPLLGWVPQVGPLIEAAPHLLDMADAGSEAGALAISGLKPALADIQQNGFGMSRLGEIIPYVTAATAELEAAGESIERYVDARNALSEVTKVEDLPWRVRQLLELSDQLVPAADGGLELAPVLSYVLGQDGTRRYLILAQNEDEIRPTGGFITGAGYVEIANGQILDLKFSDANLVDDWASRPYDFPPQPFYDFMGLELFLFRDANYWPDFPTSAEKALELYAYGQNIDPLDGAIAIDQEFLRLLVEATGPVPIPGTDQTINANNLIQTLQEARNIQDDQEVGEWVRNRKAFLSGFAAAIQSKLESDFGAIDPIKLVGNMAGAIENRHLSIYLRDPAAAAALQEAGWDGRLTQHPPGDFLMAVDTNMGYNKVGLYVERSIDYAIDLSVTGAPEAVVTLNHRHTGPPNDEPCLQGVSEEFELALDYRALADKCFFNYLRVYTPNGSVLKDSTRHTVPGEALYNGVTWDSQGQTIAELGGLTTFANFMVAPIAAETSTFFRYSLPAEVVQTDNQNQIYQLTIKKQPGVGSETLRLSIKLPAGALPQSISPAPTLIDGNLIIFESVLDSDMNFSVRYR